MSDAVMVRPLRPYLEGHAIKEHGDEPYSVSRSRALELRGNRLVEWVEPSPPAAPAAPAPDATKPRPRRAP